MFLSGIILPSKGRKEPIFKTLNAMGILIAPFPIPVFPSLLSSLKSTEEAWFQIPSNLDARLGSAKNRSSDIHMPSKFRYELIFVVLFSALCIHCFENNDWSIFSLQPLAYQKQNLHLLSLHLSPTGPFFIQRHSLETMHQATKTKEGERESSDGS